jgi:hypothetical protein
MYRSRGRAKMKGAIAASVVGLMLGIEWLSLMILALWAFAAAGWLISEMGKHGAL